MEKIKVLVLFGGQSSEHEISEMSVTNVLKNMDDRLEVYTVGITKEGKWFLYEGDYDKIKGCAWEKSDKLTPAVLSPDATMGGLIVLENDGSTRLIDIDVVYPALHGKFGEDGTIQGLCQLAGLPCVGPDMISSAICMDKTVAKIYFKELGIPQADWVTAFDYEVSENIDEVVSRIEAKLDYPVFVKPSNAGSSVGIGKAKTREDLKESLINAAKHDSKILIEEFIKGREIESAALGNRNVIVAEPGEVISCKEFYDFEAKYEAESKIQIPAEVEPEILEEVKALAEKLFKGIGLSGLSRLDFFVTEDKKVYINEINTLPGFTDISMYPKMMENIGIPQNELVFRLVSCAIDKFSGCENE